MLTNLKIGFLGAGRMATALAKGFLRSKGAAPSQIMASDLSEAARAGFVRETGAHASPSNIAVVQSSEVLFLAIKPGQVEEVLTEISGPFNEDHLLISIAAGVPLGRMQKILGPAARIIRVMPNTPALVGAGASAFAVGVATQPQDAELAQRLLATVGEAFQVKETLLDAVTGLSGSGPAYAFLLIEALSDGGVAAGLPRDVATRLAAQTLLGSARMVLETGLHPGALKDMVTSPGGTTIEGLHELEKGAVRGALMNAVRAATEKSKRLGQG